MPRNFDVRNFSDAKREALAWHIHERPSWKLPKLSAWNYDLCRIHARGWVEEVRIDDEVVTRTVFDRPKPGCRKCGIHFRNHQHISIAWLYLKKYGLLADTMGPQPLSAKVLTPSGWTTIGEISEGDYVVDPATGGRTRVAEILPQGVRPVYRVTFTDGSSTLAADSHLWEVTTSSRKCKGQAPLTLTTEEIIRRGIDYANGNHKWYVPITRPVELESSELSLDPYMIGVLLGGRAEQKKIPQEYLFASSSDRVALLQGLLDTDGTSSGHGVEWGTVSRALANQMEFLVNSLGGTFARSEKVPTYSYDGQNRTGQLFYRFHISLPKEIIPFRLPRKAEKYIVPTKYQPTRAIVSIAPVSPEEVKCIRVESDSHLYITDDFIVTHNSGKTTSAGGLLAMLHETGELSLKRDRSDKFGGVGRAILVPRAPALHQWKAELHRMMPGLEVHLSEGDAKKRKQIYLQPWRVLLIGPEMLRQDYQMLERFDLSLVLTDDVDQLRNSDTETSYVLDRLGGRGMEGLSPGTDRYVIMTGTPLQKRLPELYNVLDGIGGRQALGSFDSFERRHVRREKVTQADPKTGRMEVKEVITGYKNLHLVKQQIAPLVLRRTAADLDDVTLPTIVPNDVFLDLYPQQRKKYAELKKGVLQIIKEEGVEVKRPKALAQLHYGAAICAGLAALGEEDAPLSSVKLDWVENQLTTGEFEDEKVVIFANLKNTVRALQNRLRRAGVGFVTVWGEESNKKKRMDAQERFWTDPSCRVLIGTKAIEQSLNLQISRHLINVDMILNPARMEQLAGRIRRDGSAYQHVFVHNLLTNGTQEERYLPLLEKEAALASHIWDENSQLFNALDPIDLLRLISG